MGGFTGLILAMDAGRYPVQTRYVVAPFPLRAGGGFAVLVFAGVYFWLPKWNRHHVREKLGKVHFWLSMIFFQRHVFPDALLGLAGMHAATPTTRFSSPTSTCSRQSARSVWLSQLVLLYIVVKSIRGIGREASETISTPRTTGLEWNRFPRRSVPHLSRRHQARVEEHPLDKCPPSATNENEPANRMDPVVDRAGCFLSISCAGGCSWLR